MFQLFGGPLRLYVILISHHTCALDVPHHENELHICLFTSCFLNLSWVLFQVSYILSKNEEEILKN